MNSILLLVLMLFSALQSDPAPVRVVLSPLTEAAYVKAEKSKILTKPKRTFPLQKKAGKIVIPTTKGPKIFKDIVITEASIKQGHSEEEGTTYTYLGYLPEFKCHLVHVEYYETAEWLLINASGKQVELWGQPVFAPDLKHIAATCEGIEYGGGQPNIIQLLEFKEGALRQVWRLEPKNWEPSQIQWVSNNALILVKKRQDNKTYKEVLSYSRLLIN
jgi:hypothetical protein